MPCSSYKRSLRKRCFNSPQETTDMTLSRTWFDDRLRIKWFNQSKAPQNASIVTAMRFYISLLVANPLGWSHGRLRRPSISQHLTATEWVSNFP